MNPYLSLILSAIISIIVAFLTAWITHRYQKQRDNLNWEHEKEKMQKEQVRDIEKLRDQINQDLRKQLETKVRSDILPNIWQYILEAMGKVSIITAALREYPQLELMGIDELTEFLIKSRLSEVQQKQLLISANRNDYYMKTIFWYELNDAQTKYAEFHNYLYINKIFLDDYLFEKLSELDRAILRILTEAEYSHRSSHGDLGEYYKKAVEFNGKSNELINDIDRVIHQNLHQQ